LLLLNTVAPSSFSPQPQDWGRRFLELAADAGRGYDRVLRRYNELLTRVADGALTPEAVQEEFRAYFQESATASTRELVEASVGLLAGLLYVEARYREALLDGLLPHEGVIPPPPSPSTLDVNNWFEALAKYAAEQSARSIARQQQLVERIAAGEITVAQIDAHGRRYLNDYAPHFVGEVVELGMKFASQMQRSSTRAAEGLYDRVLGPEPASAERIEPAPILDLRGAPGTVVSARFVVENTRPVGAEVVCSMSDFVSRATGQVVPRGEISPSHFALAPGEARDVVVRLPLDHERFAPSTDYFAMLRVVGAGDRETILQLIAHADPLEAAIG
jgi:hypothetical protein